MNVDAKELIDRLEILRLEKKLSQEDLAKKLGVAFSTVNRWFNRRSQPNYIQRHHIRKMLGRNGVVIEGVAPINDGVKNNHRSHGGI